MNFKQNQLKQKIRKAHANVKRVIMSSTRGPGGKINFNERLSAVSVSLRKVSSLSEHLTSL